MAIVRLPGAALQAIESTNFAPGGDMRLICGTVKGFHSGLVTVSGTDSVGSTYPLAEIPLNTIIQNVWLTVQNGGIGTTQLDLGFYRTKRDGGTLIARDVLIDIFSLATIQNRVSVLNPIQFPVTSKDGIDLWKILFPSASRVEDTGLTHVNLTATLKSNATGSGSFVVVGNYTI